MSKHPAAVALGKLGGSVTSPAKAAASRANGKKGGRPKMGTDILHPCSYCGQSFERADVAIWRDGVSRVVECDKCQAHLPNISRLPTTDKTTNQGKAVPAARG